MAEHGDADGGLEGLPAAYAAWRASTLGRITDALELALMLEMIRPGAGQRVLDVGCGDGVLALELWQRGAGVTGVDASAGMIAAARRRAHRQGAGPRFEVARAQSLPYPADSFDAVAAVTLLCFLDDAEARRSLREIARVLGPGGRLVIGELGRWSVWAARRRLRGWLGAPLWRQARFRSGAELRALVRESGLHVEELRGAIYYPPLGLAARLLAPLDRSLGRLTTFGAAFLALAATTPNDEASGGRP